MIGKGSTRYTDDFIDVPSTHWAYEYVMTSGLKPVTIGCFEPSTPITRGVVVVLLWERAGAPMGITAPPVIHRQWNNYDAVSWAYTNGVMVGGDYINLRLSDTLTRAEAAVLIMRMRNLNESTAKVSFYDSIDRRLFETAYDAFGLIDKPYNPDSTITNGELAMAAARILCDEKNPTYSNVSAARTFEHKYSAPVNMLCHYYLGDNRDNAVYADSNATVRDAILALTFATLRSSNAYISNKGSENYPEITEFENDTVKNLLSLAHNNGIRFNATDLINPNAPVTMKQFACLLLEFDGFSGFYTAQIMGNDNIRAKDIKLNSVIDSYPSNAGSYAAILSDIPRYVYEAPFTGVVESPKESFFVTNQFRSVFEEMLSTLSKQAKLNGADVTFTMYPSLSVNNGNGYTFRVKVNVIKVSREMILYDIVDCANEQIGQTPLTDGTSFFADVETGKPFDDVYFPIANVFISNIVW